jgi:hypothetical protein
VGILDTPGVMYVWDQCFMQCWRHSVLQNVCLALMELLRHRFMEARDYLQMKEVSDHWEREREVGGVVVGGWGWCSL